MVRLFCWFAWSRLLIICKASICQGILPPHTRIDEFYTSTKFHHPPLRPHRLTVRTPGFHPGNRGSIPREVTMKLSRSEKFHHLLCGTFLLRSSLLCGARFFLGWSILPSKLKHISVRICYLLILSDNAKDIFSDV